MAAARTLMRRDTPAVAKNSSSRSKLMEHSMSLARTGSPACSVARTCTMTVQTRRLREPQYYGIMQHSGLVTLTGPASAKWQACPHKQCCRRTLGAAGQQNLSRPLTSPEQGPLATLTACLAMRTSPFTATWLPSCRPSCSVPFCRQLSCCSATALAPPSSHLERGSACPP